MSLPADIEVELQWWESQGQTCPRCGDRGVPIVLEVTDESTRIALQHRLACLGDCCLDGLEPDHECRKCGHRF
jgi:hypothetical protein